MFESKWCLRSSNPIQIEIGDTCKKPKFGYKRGELGTFVRVVASPMLNQDGFTEADYDNAAEGIVKTSRAIPPCVMTFTSNHSQHELLVA